ncbi:MAG: amidohydrolase family protein [Planctomycetota bacterium]
MIKAGKVRCVSRRNGMLVLVLICELGALTLPRVVVAQDSEVLQNGAALNDATWALQDPPEPPRPRRRRPGGGRPPGPGADPSAPSAPDAAAKPAADAAKKTTTPDSYLAIEGGIVHTVTGATLDGARVLVKNGRIAAIGAEIEIPKDAERLDAKGLHVYPGLIGLNTRGILSEPDGTDFYNLNLTLALSAGMTTIATGNSVLKLTFGTPTDHALRTEVFSTLSYSSNNPGGRRALRESLERVRQHLRDLDRYEKDRARDPEVKRPDESWIRGPYQQAMRLMRQEQTAIADGETAQDLLELCGLAEQFDFGLVIRGAREGYLVARELARAGVAVIIDPRVRADRDETRIADNGSAIENARILHDHGVQVTISPGGGISLGGLGGRDLQHLTMAAAFAVRGGLSEVAAIESITIEAARLLEVDHRVGSIEVGKDADFAITDGELLHYMTHVRYAIVNGKIAYDKQKDSLYRHIRPDGQLDPPPPPDHWPRELGQAW